MARGALNWSAAELAEAAGNGPRSVARFETGGPIRAEFVEAMRRAFERAGVRFLMNGPHRGAVMPPPLEPLEDASGGNPLMPRQRT
jgi:hypothetical protein